MNSILCYILCLYAFIKYLFGYNANNKIQGRPELKRYLLRFIFTTLTLFASLFSACFLLPFFTFYHILAIYLRLKLGSGYGGMLKRQDSGMASVKKKMVIRIVFILNQNKQNPMDWSSCLQSARKIHLSSYKLSSTVENSLGYAYFLKNQTSFEDVVEQQRIGDGRTITKDVFLDYVNNLRPSPGGKRLWSFRYFPQEILWNNKTTKQHAIIISFHHCLADGPNLLKYFMEYLMEDPYKPPQSNLLDNLKNLPKFSIDDAYISENPIFPSRDIFPKMKESSDEVYTAIYSEDTEKYLNLIKKVKTKVGVGFNSVVLGAFASSLANHLKKHHQPPTDVTILGIIRPEEINLVFKSNDEDPITNDVGNQIIKIPANEAVLSTSERLHSINERIKLIRRSVESTMTYTMCKYMHYLPSPIQRLGLWLSMSSTTSLVTNMSGVENLAFGGYPLQSLLFFVSDLPPAFTFCMMSLDGRLQLTLHASGVYVSSRVELMDIIDGTLECIDKFAKEFGIH